MSKKEGGNNTSLINSSVPNHIEQAVRELAKKNGLTLSQVATEGFVLFLEKYSKHYGYRKKIERTPSSIFNYIGN